MTRRRRQPAQVQSVTSAPRSLHEDQQHRIHQYLLSMGIRTLCFVLAVYFIVGLGWTIAGWVCAVAAVVLPYFAVMFANAVQQDRGETGTLQSPVLPLPPGPEQRDGQDRPQP